MARTYAMGRVAGLQLTVDSSAIIGSALLCVLLSGIAALGLDAPPAAAVAGGLVAVLLHWASDIVHQLGHARVARATGYPMIGIRLWWLLSARHTFTGPRHTIAEIDAEIGAPPPLPEAP